MTSWPASKAGREYPRPPKIVRDSTRSSEDLLPLHGRAGQSRSNPRFSLRERLVGRSSQEMKPPKDQMSRVYLLALATIPNGKASPQPSKRRLGILSGKRPTSSLVWRSGLQPQQDQHRTRVRLFACRFRAPRIHPLQNDLSKLCPASTSCSDSRSRSSSLPPDGSGFASISLESFSSM
jgi:hypothetical protein